MGAAATGKKTGEALVIDRKDFGRSDSLSHNVLTLVADEHYDRAIENLKNFLENDSGYPALPMRISRHIKHAVDIVNAIRAKRGFPGFASLTAAKQKELIEKTLFHFEELKYVLRKIERIHVDTKLEDIRSTAIVIKAIVYAAIVVVMVAFLREASKGLFYTLSSVIEEYFSRVSDFICDLIGI